MRLIDADALLEAVKDSAEINVGVITALVTHVSLSDVMETITNAPTIQREGWVSVEDRLPPLDAVSKEYNVVTKYGEVTTTTFDVFNLGTDKQFGVFNGMPVVFWQPMPAAPTDKE